MRNDILTLEDLDEFKKDMDNWSHESKVMPKAIDIMIDFICKCEFFGDDWCEDNLVCSANDCMEELQKLDIPMIDDKIASYYGDTDK